MADQEDDDQEQFQFLNEVNENRKPQEKIKKGVTFTDAKDIIGGDDDDMDFERESGRFGGLSEKGDEGDPVQKSHNKNLVRKSTVRYFRNTNLRTTEVLTKDSFDYIKQLGEGAYGKVYLVKKKNT